MVLILKLCPTQESYDTTTVLVYNSERYMLLKPVQELRDNRWFTCVSSTLPLSLYLWPFFFLLLPTSVPPASPLSNSSLPLSLFLVLFTVSLLLSSHTYCWLSMIDNFWRTQWTPTNVPTFIRGPLMARLVVIVSIGVIIWWSHVGVWEVGVSSVFGWLVPEHLQSLGSGSFVMAVVGWVGGRLEGWLVMMVVVVEGIGW